MEDFHNRIEFLDKMSGRQGKCTGQRKFLISVTFESFVYLNIIKVKL